MLSLFACRNNPDEYSVDYTITSPKKDWAYSTERTVLLSTNLNSKEISWSSSADGKLGTGNNLTVYLSSGEHTIYAEYNGCKKSVYITVDEEPANGVEVGRTLITKMPFEKTYKDGTYLTYLVSGDAEIKNISVSFEDNVSNSLNIKRGRMIFTEDSSSANEIKRDFHVESKVQEKSLVKNKIYSRSASTESSRCFYVIDTSNQENEPHYVEADKYYSSNLLTVWIPETDLSTIQNDATIKEMLSEAISNAEKILIPRVTAIWGICADINKDGAFSLLFSSTINDEQTAIGFFNPLDFFANCKDEKNEDYNPSSNEMDLLYIALPETGSSNYSVGSISATIAHELTHAVNFTIKTYNRILSGEENSAQEETFLDEGWSHLTENLCGFGVSGGNIQFFRRYLQHPEYYSFCKDNIYGQSDCVGQRGAMTLFLSWLFWKSGGMSWSDENKIYLVDKGGISFLRQMTSLSQTGWSSIGAAFGKNTDSLFYEMIDEIQNAEAAGEEYISRLDPVTAEPVDFFVNMNAASIADYAGNLTPVEISSYVDSTLLPWSISVFNKISFSSAGSIVISGKYEDGTAFVFDRKVE